MLNREKAYNKGDNQIKQFQVTPNAYYNNEFFIHNFKLHEQLMKLVTSFFTTYALKILFAFIIPKKAAWRLLFLSKFLFNIYHKITIRWVLRYKNRVFSIGK